MLRRIVFTEEEREQDKKDTLELLKKMPNCSQIARELGRSHSYILNIKNCLINEGLITKDEISHVREEKKQREIEELDKNVLKLLKEGLTQSAIRTKLARDIRTIQDSIKRLINADPNVANLQTKKTSKKNEIKKKIVELVNRGCYVSDIIKKLSLSTHSFDIYIGELEDEGKINRKDLKYKSLDIKNNRTTRNQQIYRLYDDKVPIDEIATQFGLREKTIKSIIKNRKRTRKYVRPKKKQIDIFDVDSEILSQSEMEIVELIKEGFSYHYISKKYGIDMPDLMIMINKFKKMRFLSQSVINTAQNERRYMYLNGILLLLKNGVIQKDIYRILNPGVEDISQSKISRMTDELIDMGLITREDILYAKNISEHGNITIDEKVLGYLKKGIARCDMHLYDEFITPNKARTSTFNLIKSGEITSDKIKRQRKRRCKSVLSKSHEKDERKVWKLIVEYGATNKKIAEDISAIVKAMFILLLKALKRKRNYQMQNSNL